MDFIEDAVESCRNCQGTKDRTFGGGALFKLQRAIASEEKAGDIRLYQRMLDACMDCDYKEPLIADIYEAQKEQPQDEQSTATAC